MHTAIESSLGRRVGHDGGWWFGVGCGLCLAVGVGAAPLSELTTARQSVTNVYHGVAVVEDYQWLEEADAPAVREWSRLQNVRTRGYLDALPSRAGLAQHLEAILGEGAARYVELQRAGGRLFALRFKPPAQQPVLVELSAIEAPVLRRTVFDPNVWNDKGTTAIDWFVPSPDGRRVAVSLSENGSEDGTLHFFESDTGRHLEDVVPRVQYPTGGGSVAWSADGEGVFYTRYPHAGERPEADANFFQQVWFHRLGTDPARDTYEIGREFPRIAEIELERSEDGRQILAVVANGDGGDFSHYLRTADGAWRPLTRDEDGIKAAKFGPDGGLYLLRRKGAPRGEVLHLEPGAGLAQATVVVPEGAGTVQGFEPTEAGLYVESLRGGPSELKFYAAGRRSGRPVPLRPVSSVAEVHGWERGQVLVGQLSYLEPFGYYVWGPGDRALRPTALRVESTVDFGDIEVVREFAVSKDGTRVPLNILRRRGLRRDGSHPCLLYGYGGYGVSLSPSYRAALRIWFDAGGVYAEANLRGGGEYGEAWHLAGNLTRKQTVFDDFIACAEHVVARGYTQPSRLAVQGGSNGGLLMGAFLTQRPDLARAVVAQVGIYDMLRVELDPNGQFNVTEFGTVKNPEQFRALYAYSPYHRVRDGTAYPAVLLTTGEHDGRVNPAQSRKMAARLQAATRSGHPVLYRSTATMGHGQGSALSDRIALQADVYAFLFDQLGIDGARWTFGGVAARSAAP